jgi:hypothetical protein
MQLSSDWAAAHTLHSCTHGLQGLAIPHILWPPYIFHYIIAPLVLWRALSLLNCAVLQSTYGSSSTVRLMAHKSLVVLDKSLVGLRYSNGNSVNVTLYLVLK